MLSHLLGSHPHGHDGKLKSPTAAVAEVMPSPEHEKSNPSLGSPEPEDDIQSFQSVTSPRAAATPSKRLPKRQSFFGRVTSGIASEVHSWFHDTDEYVKEQHVVIRTKIQRELGANVSGDIFETTYEGLQAWINEERMRRVPHKGGPWDRVLVAAQHFAKQIELLYGWVSFTKGTSGLVYGQCLMLLQLGHENAKALEKVFNLVYQLGLDLRPLLRRHDLFHKSAEIQDNLGKAYVALMDIVTDVAIDSYQAVHGLKSVHGSVTVDVFQSSEPQIETFRSRLQRCANQMWIYTLSQKHVSDGKDVSTLQRWLAPDDSVLAFLASNHINLAARPAANTCTWFQKPLNGFLKGENTVLVVEGKNGSGKTTLANWAIDRLQRYSTTATLNFAFNPSLATQATSLAMLKTLLYQLMAETAIGNAGVYKAIKEVYYASKTRDADEEQLWTALKKALKALDDEKDDDMIVIVVDGIDELNASSKNTGQRISQRLYDIVESLDAVKVIQFSDELDLSLAHSTRIKIETETFDDISTLVQGTLREHAHFADRDFVEQDQMVNDLTTAASGSMLWASLACATLRFQETHGKFTETANALKSSVKTIPEIVQKLLAAMHLDSESKLILSWIFAAERPLTLPEISLLLQINLERGSISDRPVNLDASLRKVSPFIVRSEGLVGVRHSLVEQVIISLRNDNKLSLHLTERHRELMTRLFVYVKAILHDTHRPTFDVLDLAITAQKFHDNRLLEYAVRYWAVHFKKSKLMKAELPSELIALFPTSVVFTLLEWRCWDMFSVNEAIEMHLLAHRVRVACFGSKEACVLQSTVTCATLLVASERHTEGIEFYYQATKLSRGMLGLRAEITLACCNHLLRFSESLVSKQRTTIMTYREETLLVIVEIYQHSYGKHSKQVLEVYQLLIALYEFIGEESKAAIYYKIIQEIMIIIRGPGSEQDNEMSRQLDIVLKKHKETETVDTFDRLLFAGGYIDFEEAFTIEYVRTIIIRIREIILRGEFLKAEEMYIELWLRITEHCQHVHLIEWHEQKIRVMFLYATFLQERKRITEATSILVCIWEEYEHHEFSRFENIIVILKEVAVLMTTLSMFAFALAVFQKCRSWYVSHQKQHLEIFKEIEVHISKSVEIVESTTTRSTTTTKSSETVMREVFESSLTSTEISTTTIKMCESLTSIFIKEKRYSEAITHIESTIRKSWSFFFEESIQTISLTSTFRQESIDLVVRLIECYISMSRLEVAEYYYLRLFRAIKSSCKVDDKLFVKYSELILAFYSAHGFYHKAITFYQELLVEYRSFYGHSHAITIRTLYALGELCRKYQRTHGYWIEYYLEILTVLNKGSVICHEDALRALVIVARYYYEDCRYSESLQYFKCILATYVKYGKTYKFFFERVEEVQEIFTLYFRALQESKTEISVQISILKEFREASILIFGATATIVIHATFQLAETCTRSEKYEFEAISLYEFVCKHSESSSTEIITKSKTTMRSLYVKQVTSTTTTVTKETLETAISYSYERYEEIRKSYSCTHELVLSHFKELFILYYKASKVEIAIKEFRKLVVECITKVTVAKELIETAKFLVGILISCSFVKQAWELVHELRIQVIYRSTKNVSLFGFNLTTIGRQCFAFIAAFEYHLRAVYTITIADFMAEIVAEYLYYERFCSHIKSKAGFYVVFSAAARLRQTLSKRERLEYFEFVQKDAIQYFFDHETEVVKTCTRSSAEVYVTLLLEYFTDKRVINDNFEKFVAACGHAAEMRITLLISQGKHREAFELTKCTFKYLMKHEGLDDEKEIALGFRLAVLMSNRGGNRTQDTALYKEMIALSNEILKAVFVICDAKEIDLVRLQLSELNDLICLVGEQKDWDRLLKLLTDVWKSREGQTRWGSSTTLKEQKLSKRLVQARFLAGATKQAIRLCQDIVYNVRRVYGVRHKLTLSLTVLLASLFIRTGLNEVKQNNETMAKFYFRKAIELHVNDLKTLVDEDDSGASDDEDFESEMGSTTSPSIRGVGQKLVANGTSVHSDRYTELKAVRDHLRLLKLAFQRAGGFQRPKDVETVTAKAWSEFGSELKMKKEEVLSAHWTSNSYGGGRAESIEDDWKEPNSWSITAKNE